MNEFQHQSARLTDQIPDASAASHQTRARQIGERVRTARIVAHLTHQELAGETYTKSYISAVERGKMTPSLLALGRLAERLGVSHAFLLGEDPRALAHEAAPHVAEESTSAPADAAFQEGRVLLRSQAEECLRAGRYEEALALYTQAEDVALLSHIHEVYATFLAAQARYQEAYEQILVVQSPFSLPQRVTACLLVARAGWSAAAHRRHP